MKKLIHVAIILLIATIANAQNTQLPAPAKLKILQPGDLVITGMSIANASFSNDVKPWVIKASITVKNAGQIITSATNLTPWVKKGTGVWKQIGTNAILIGLKPGESVTKEYVFVDKQRELARTDAFSFKVQADFGNRIKEGNENNNESSVLTISPSN